MYSFYKNPHSGFKIYNFGTKKTWQAISYLSYSFIGDFLTWNKLWIICCVFCCQLWVGLQQNWVDWKVLEEILRKLQFYKEVVFDFLFSQFFLKILHITILQYYIALPHFDARSNWHFLMIWKCNFGWRKVQPGSHQ